MRIQRLDITGFKSFMDRTVFSFDEGITGVVGPNGCGKSNVVDAIRWVMGEQSAKNLRGRGMEDVIFNGSEAHAPLSMAEVTLTFKVEPHDTLPPTVAGLPEVSVTRRLFRSGESEYLINKTTCRLLDVTELFLGTGVGTRAYSIIEQGRVGQIVSARPEDRRAFIEEAAGVTRYKARRKAAERKMEHTQNNLLRVNDVVSELERRLDALDRQARKAEKYKKLRAEVRQIELRQAGHKYLEQLALGKALAARLEGLTADERAGLEQVQALEAEISAAREALEVDSQALEALAAETAHLDGEVQLARQREQHQAAEGAAAAERARRARAEVETLAERQVALAKEQEQIEAELQALAGAGREDEVALQVAQAEAGRVAHLQAEIAPRLEKDRTELLEAAARIAELEARVQSIEVRQGEQAARRERLAAEVAVLRGEEGQVEQSRAEVLDRVGTSRQLALELAQRRGEEEVQLQSTRDAFAENEIQVICLREELADKRSRLQSLEELQRNYEGYERGVRAVMTRAGEDPARLGVRGVLAQLLSTSPEYERAVEAVLGERLQHVVVDSPERAFELARSLSESREGRGTFVPLPEGRAARVEASAVAPVEATPVEATPEIAVAAAPATLAAPAPLDLLSVSVGPAASVDSAALVEALIAAQEAEFAAAQAREAAAATAAAAIAAAPVVAAPVVAAPVVAAPVATAQAALARTPTAVPADALCAAVDVVHGADAGVAPLLEGLFDQVVFAAGLDAARRIAEAHPALTVVTLEGEVFRPGFQVTGGALEGPAVGALQKKREMDELSREVKQIEERYNEIVTRHYALQKQMGHSEGVLKGLARNQHAEELSLATHEKDLHQAASSLQRIRERVATVEAEEAEVARGLDGLKAESDAVRGELVHAQTDRQARDERVKLLTSELQTLKGRAESFAAELTRVRVRVAQADEKVRAQTEALARLGAQRDELAARAKALAEQADQDAAQALSLEEAVRDGTLARESRERRLQELKATLEERHADHRARKDAVMRREGELRELRAKVDTLTHGLSQAAVQEREIALEIEHLTAQVAERHGATLGDAVHDFHWQKPITPELEQRLKDVRGQIERMGEVNLTAIEEHEELRKRFEFLSKQQQDLQASLKQLEDAIDKIDQTSRERFKQTFEVVNEKFQQIYPRLFGGGRASLVLAQDVVGQEAGVDIIAQPPGKKLQSISLLSGGEKALTAVGMIFAIFLIKPTPFCLLDEVDAPLDEANVGRYNDMVREMSKQSQFILITHNKRTMEVVDTLYGVTMEEPGVSKQVSVKLHGAAANQDQAVA